MPKSTPLSKAPTIVVVMGVSGSGKTTIGQTLALHLHCAFVDGDDLHPQANIDKMRQGQALSDVDRHELLQRVAGQIEAWHNAGQAGVIACSALKRRYRDMIGGGRGNVIFVSLEGTQELIAARLSLRQGHFMPPSLLASQFGDLEPPALDEPAIRIDIARNLDETVARILRELASRRRAGQVATTIAEDAATLAETVADWFMAQIQGSGPIAIALAGGSTPRAFYECLMTPRYRGQIPWSRLHWFWGDERFVPHASTASNFRMFLEAMGPDSPIPATNLHPIETSGVSVSTAAARYERELKSFYGADVRDPQRPVFAVTLLGLGNDGHTASLFPGTAALEEREKWAMATTAPDGSSRITLTYPVLESSAHVAFIVSGADKRDIVARFLGDTNLPASRLAPWGPLRLFVDRDALPSR